MAMRRQRQRLELCFPKSRNTKDCEGLAVTAEGSSTREKYGLGKILIFYFKAPALLEDIISVLNHPICGTLLQ